MTYESLLLNLGGGVIPSGHRSRPYAGAAALLIGIGGTGVDVLTKIKRKVYQDLIPDNPNDPIPRYDHIQFLAIDSDEDVIAKMKGRAKIDPASEFFSLSDPYLWKALKNKDAIYKNPLLNWLEIDKIFTVLSPVRLDGIRQIGRYLLISSAAALKSKIEEKCAAALRGMDSPSLDIYIFAGLSGGTGSGCFLDTCYIVRKVLEDNDWTASANIMGFFFLPDVVNAKPEIAAIPSLVDHNCANAYAALAELDYHMDLKAAYDSFQQNYGEFSVDTQEPPVDFCYLLSATLSDGSVLPNGYSYAIGQTVDYVMSCLADVYLYGFTMRGCLASMRQGMLCLPRAHGANYSYLVLRGDCAEVPVIQISTYLAAGFYRRFQVRVGRETAVITQAAVDDLMKTLGLTAGQVYHEVVKGCNPLSLPDIYPKDLAMEGILPRGYAPQFWVQPGDEWRDRCSSKREENRAALTAEPTTFDWNQVSADSLTGKVFRKLYELSMDPEYGPYYAAGLLNSPGYDMISALNSAIKQTEEELEAQKSHFHSEDGPPDCAAQCSANFIHKSSKKNYQLYKESIINFYLMDNHISELRDTIAALRSLRYSLEKLYRAYFVPLLQLLDNLKETFSQNMDFLNSSAAASAAYTRHILELRDIRPRLAGVVDGLDDHELVTSFMVYLLKGYDQWQDGDDGKIGQYISRYMERIFDAEFNRSLQDYLFDIYPEDDGSLYCLAQEVEQHLIEPLHHSVLPLFWCDPVFDITDPRLTYQSSRISVPCSASAVCNAADSFKSSHPEYLVRETGVNNRISISQLFAGVPMYACAALPIWKHAYDETYFKNTGAGIHLYAYTGRGMDDSGTKDWRTMLPDPPIVF